MQIISVRFSNDQIELIRQEAAQDGVSSSQFIRDAAHVRAVMNAARRNAVTVQLFNHLLAVVESEGNERVAAELSELLSRLSVIEGHDAAHATRDSNGSE